MKKARGDHNRLAMMLSSLPARLSQAKAYLTSQLQNVREHHERGRTDENESTSQNESFSV